MGLTSVHATVGHPDHPEQARGLDFLVDSGAIYSVVPATVLEELGIKPYTEQDFSLANGEHIKRQKGVAMFRFEGKVGAGDVIFGQPGDANLLGAFTLESLGLVLDPFCRELRPIPMLM
jgi:clan AA aspartic protease